MDYACGNLRQCSASTKYLCTMATGSRIVIYAAMAEIFLITVANFLVAALRARVEIIFLFGRRCTRASGVARRLNTPGIRPPRALLARRIATLIVRKIILTRP